MALTPCIVSILVVSAAMAFRGAGQNRKPRSNVRRRAEELDLEIEAVYRRREQEREGSFLQEMGPCDSANYSSYPGG